MKVFCRIASVLIIILAVMSGTKANATQAGAGYRFDNVYTPYGLQTQWMIITKAGNTAGDWAFTLNGDEEASVPLEIAGNIVNKRSSLSVINGRVGLNSHLSDVESDNKLKVIFLVLAGNSSEEEENTFAIDFYYPGVIKDDDNKDDDDAVTTDTLIYTTPYYVVKKVPQNGTLTDSKNGTGKQYKFLFQRQSAAEYGSVKGYIRFTQVPSDTYPSTTSQTTQIPFVLANVDGDTAQNQPLIFDTILRNNRNFKNGEIVAYDRFTWTVQGKETHQEKTPWVFVPVGSLNWSNNNGEKINYYLTTKVTNRTGTRYTVHPYDYPDPYPKYWEFDLPALTDYSDLPSSFSLDELSHIAPGLRTVFRDNINMNEIDPELMQLYPVDPAESSPYALRIRYRPVYGYTLGEVEGTSSSSNIPVPYRVTAFNPRAVSPSFLNTVAVKMSADNTVKTILVPETSGYFSNSDVTADYISSGVYKSFAISKNITGTYTATGYEGMLPLVVTFNIPSTEISSTTWDTMLEEWYKYDDTATLKNLFRNTFTVGLLSTNNGNNMPMFLDLIKRLENEHHEDWTDFIKVFPDEDRGVLTVSFIILMLDGTSDGTNPATGIVEDSTSSDWIQTNKFIAIRDGYKNNKWEMTFFVAPADYTTQSQSQTNASTETNNTTTTTTNSSGGGGGCNLGLMASFAFILFLFAVRYSIIKGR